MKKDITTKEVLKQIAEDIALYLLDLHVSDLDFVDKELQIVEKRESDLVGHCHINGIESILHLEIQNDNDPTMHFRMLRYYALIKTRFPNLPVHQCVIYIGRGKLKMLDKIHTDGLSYHYQLIDMHNIDCETLLAINKPSALVLAVLCDFKGKPETEVLFHILTRLEQLTGDDEYAYGKYTLALETLSDNRNLKQRLKEAEAMLRTVTMEQLPSYEIGFEKGALTGRQEGRQEGRAGAMVEMFLNMLGMRFPNFDLETYKEKIVNVTDTKLTEYGLKIATAKTPDEVFADDEEIPLPAATPFH